MRGDAERPMTDRLLRTPVPDRWQQVLTSLRSDPLTRLSIEDIRAEAAQVLIVAPTVEVSRCCCAEILASLPDGFVTVVPPESLVPASLPAGTWIFLPHRADGWQELETASATLHRAITEDNRGREPEAKLTVVEFGINLWLWTDPPAGVGDPVCHAGELISWESAWALGETGYHAESRSDTTRSRIARPPIYFGLPPALHRRRRRVVTASPQQP